VDEAPAGYIIFMSDPATLRAQAATWYNEAWTLLLKTERTEAEDLDLVSLAQASFRAWLEVPNHTPTHESIGAWMISRTFSATEQGHLAETWARRALECAAEKTVDPFYRSYAREALARSLRVQGRHSEVVAEVRLARLALAGTAEDDLDALDRDLTELESEPAAGPYTQISVHRPKASFFQQVVDSMHRYGAAARTQKGLLEVKTLKSFEGTHLIGYAVWKSKADKDAAVPALRSAVSGDDFATWEEGDIEGWELDPI